MKKNNKSLKQRRKNNKTKHLEKIYRQYLTPMSLDEWANVKSLKQPSLLKQVQTKTVYSFGG